jgi:hypothetical protein
MLVEQKVIESEVKKSGIHVSEFDIDLEMEQIAKSKGMSLDQFRNYLAKRGSSEADLRDQIRTKYQKQRLYRSIASSKLQPMNDQDLRAYYNAHPEEFSSARSYQVMKFSSSSKAKLNTFIKTGKGSSQYIHRVDQTLRVSSLDKKLASMFARMPVKSITPVMRRGGQYTFYFLVKKIGQKKIPFEKVKGAIFAKAMQGHENSALRAYFEKQKAEASIEVIRGGK